MKAFLTLLFATVAVQAIDWSHVRPMDYYLGRRDVSPFITNGQEATPHQFPWQAGLIMTLDQGQAFCGGCLISDEWIMTAGHCVKDVRSFEVILGAHEIQKDEPSQIRMTSTDSILHESYSALFIHNDIGLVRLPSKVTFNENIKAIRLPSLSQADSDFKGEEGIVSGWGKDSDDATGISPILRFEKDTIISNFICKLQYLFQVKDSNICLDGSDGRSTCNGDSGGPLYIVDADSMPTQVGIVSFGKAAGCALGYHPVFTRVTSYLDWIEKQTGIPISP